MVWITQSEHRLENKRDQVSTIFKIYSQDFNHFATSIAWGRTQGINVCIHNENHSMFGVTWNVAPESSNHVRASWALYRTSPHDDSSRERNSSDWDSTTLTWLPFGEWFKSVCLCVRSNHWQFSCPFIDQFLETLWPIFLQWVQKSRDRLFLDFDHCQFSLLFGRLVFRPVFSTCSLNRMFRPIDSVE